MENVIADAVVRRDSLVANCLPTGARGFIAPRLHDARQHRPVAEVGMPVVGPPDSKGIRTGIHAALDP